MADNLSDVGSCCRGLDADKITDRKKSVEKLKQLLSKDSVVKSLDKNTEERQAGHGGNRLITWNDIFKAVIVYLKVETAALQKVKESQSRTASLNKDKKKQEISAVFKFFIRAADKRGPRLKCMPVISHILEILKNDFTCSAFGQDYNTILLKNILPVRKYWVELKPETWHELLIQYCRLYLSCDCCLDHVVLARLINIIVSGVSRQCDFQTKKIIIFFTEAFKNIRQEKVNQVSEYLLSALNTFSRKIAPNCRIQLIKLGETIFVNLLHLWSTRPTDVMKDEIVEFLRLQLHLHHPCGVKSIESGAMAVDWDSWKSSLRKLYEVIYCDLQQMGDRNRFMSSAKDSSLSFPYVDLGADVCNQLFSDCTYAIEVTQLTMLGDGDASTPNKKRKLESGWSCVIDILADRNNSLQIIPWLQLVSRLVEKYPAGVPEDQLIPLLQCLSQLLTDCKRSKILHHLFGCLTKIVHGYESFSHIAASILTTSKALWLNIWSESLRTMSSHYAEVEGFQQPGFTLLSAIVAQRLVVPEREVWNLFLPGVSIPTEASVQFLVTFLRLYDLPENFRPNILGSIMADERGMYPLRKHLFDWFIPRREVSEVGSKRKNMTKIEPELVGQVLTSLTVRRPGSVLEAMQNVSEEKFTEIENLYLQTTLNKQVNFEKTADTTQDTDGADVSHIPVLLKHLMDKLQQEKAYFEDLIELQLQSLEDLVYVICLVSKCLRNFLQYKIISPDMIPVLGLDGCLQGLLKKLTAGLADFINKDGTSHLLLFVELLDKLFVWSRSKEHSTFVVCELIRKLMPSKLFSLLFDVAFDKFSKSSSTARKSGMDLPRFSRKSSFERRSTSTIASRSHVLDDFDDMDIEFDDPSTSKKGDNLDICSDDDALGESQESDEMTTQPDVCVSLLSKTVLSDSQRLRLEFVRALCHCSGFERCRCLSEIPYKAETDSTSIKSRLLQLLDDELFDASRPVDLQIFEIIVHELTTTDHKVTEMDLESMICILRQVAKTQRQDQEVASLCLELLSRLVPHLRDSMPSSMAKRALELISAFLKLQVNGSCSSRVRLTMTTCMQAFVECDPSGTWSSLKSTSDSDQTTTIVSKFPNSLLDSCHAVRMYAAQAFQSLFVINENGQFTPKEKQFQLSAFDRIYEVCNELLDISDKLSSEKMQDERTNRTATSLLALGTIACTSPVCEKNCLFAFSQLIKEKNLEITPVKKILHKVATTLGYKDIKSYICSHLPFLVHQWLDLEYRIAEFPFALLSVTSKSMFYREYTSVLVPELLMHQQLNSIQEVAESLGVDSVSLLRDCVPVIVVHILPMLAASKTGEAITDTTVRKRTSLASKCYKILEQQISKEAVDASILHHLDKIIVNILMCLYDEREMEGGDGLHRCDPDPNPPYYNSFIIKSTLDYLTQSFSGNSKCLISVLAKTQDSIQKVLLELSVHLSLEHRVHEKRRVLHMYQLFVGMLLAQFKGRLGGSWAFIFRDVIHRVIHILRDINTSHRKCVQTEQRYATEITEMCLDLLYRICHVGVELCPEELVKYLPRITSNTLGCVSESRVGQKASRLLDYLVLENAQLLKDGIINLNPFPDRAVFHRYTKIYDNAKRRHQSSLRMEIQHFVDVYGDHQSLTEGSVEGIRHLCALLASKSTALSSLVQQGREGGDNSLLCQLVCQLLHLAQCSVQPISQEATCCLGVIGPIDLCAVSLPKPALKTELQEALAAFSDDPNMQKYCTIFHQLKDYLVDPCIDVVRSAGEVLRAMFATREGGEFYTLYKAKLTSGHLLPYLHPFRPPKKIEMSADAGDFHCGVDCDMWIVSHGDYGVWVTDITCTLLQSGAVTDELLRLLKPICKIKSKFCETILPFLIHDILVTGSQVYQATLSNIISCFFHEHCQLVLGREGRSSTSQSLSGETSICLNRDAVQTMLNVVQYLRQQERPQQTRVLTPWDNNFWLNVDYLEVAKAAQYCSAYFSTILYTEIWSDTKRCDGRTDSQSQSERVSQEFSQNTRMDVLSSPPPSPSRVGVQDLVLDAYRCIGDPDGIYGCGAGRLADSSSRVKTYQHENKWEKAVITYDIEMKNAPLSQQLGLLQTVQNFGAESLLGLCLQGVSATSQQTLPPELQELQYEAAWRAGQWGLDIPSRLDSGMSFHQSLYCALDALKDDQLSLAKIAVDAARCSVLKTSDVNVESCRSIYPLLCRLHCLAQVDDVLTVVDRKDGNYLDIVEKWNSETLVSNEFEFVEPVLTVRCSLIKLLGRTRKADGLQAGLADHLHSLARLARDSRRYQVAERCISDLKDNLGSDTDNRLRVDLEEAELYWARAEHNIAKHLMKALISNLEKLQDETFEAIRLLPAALGTYGNWLAETRSENPSVIMDNYLQRAVDLLEAISADDDLALEAYLSLAQFVDTQYQNIVNYMKSSTFEAKRALMKKAKEDAEKFKTVVNNNDRYLRTLEKQSAIDEQEVVTLAEDRSTFLEKAVSNYSRCLRLGDRHDLRAFRLTSLWFENASSPVVNHLLNESIPFIKSYKFLPLLYQLAARMSIKQNNCALFQPTLEKILETAAVDHPHHGIPVIMGLAHANKDAELIARSKSAKRGGKLSRGNQQIEGEEDRVQAAKNMIEKLKKNAKVSEIVRNLETLSTAYIELANWNVDQYKKETKAISLPASLMLTQLKHLDNLAVPTVETKVDPSGKYDNIVSIQQFRDKFKLAGGINLPKILTVVGSDGVERRQLVKGRDDLRQDAVMQQVFGMLNNLLHKNPETRKRSLRVRTYKVIPLSQRSGLLEWCEGTQPIGEYLIGSASVKGAHHKYYPQDWSPLDCRKHITTSSNDVKKKLSAYLEACKHFHPVFRHFFMERFSDPATWFDRRLAYTRSVATNSVVGYILGLGDRHIMNILIDCNTAELIHIDLGIAFEQGKILPTPETVPFRLTRDIVDGMGVTGVEGVFRRCCEKTMAVLHDNQQLLLMIIQVLLYDPLYVWTLSPQKAYALQRKRDRTEPPDQSELNTTTVTDIDTDSAGSGERLDEVNKVAERVLLRLHQKLQGVEDGIQLSIIGQVNYIIQEARDPKNLCRLFPGWQAYV